MLRFSFCGAMIAVALLTSCADDAQSTLDKAGDKTQQAGDAAEQKAREAAETLEEKVRDRLECTLIDHRGTLERVEHILENYEELGLEDLLSSPEDLAEIVALMGTTTEASVLLARNVAQLLEQGALGELMANGWEGVDCTDPTPVVCTAGTASIAATCGDGDEASSSLRVEFTDCTLSGRRYAGAMTVQTGEVDGAVRVVFDGLTIDEKTELSGDLQVAASGSEARSLSARSTDALTIRIHGGHEASACGETLTFNALGLTQGPGGLDVEFDLAKETPDARWHLRTLGPDLEGRHLHWDDLACPCPAATSAVDVDFPRPLGRDGETATVRVRYGEASPSSCGSTSVEMLDWPASCGDLPGAGADCGRATAEKTLAALLGAVCVGIPQ